MNSDGIEQVLKGYERGFKWPPMYADTEGKEDVYRRLPAA